MKLRPLYPPHIRLNCKRKTRTISSRAFFQAWAGSPYKSFILFELIYLKDKYSYTTTLDRYQNSIHGIGTSASRNPRDTRRPQIRCSYPTVRATGVLPAYAGISCPKSGPQIPTLPLLAAVDYLRLCVQSGLLPLALTGHDTRTRARFEAGVDAAHQGHPHDIHSVWSFPYSPTLAQIRPNGLNSRKPST